MASRKTGAKKSGAKKTARKSTTRKVRKQSENPTPQRTETVAPADVPDSPNPQ